MFAETDGLRRMFTETDVAETDVAETDVQETDATDVWRRRMSPRR